MSSESDAKDMGNPPGCPHLPQVLVEEILSRVSVASLMRFKCVCKSWHALLTGRSFANKHLRASSSSSSSLYFIIFWRIYNGDVNDTRPLDEPRLMIDICDTDGGLACVMNEPTLPPPVIAKLECEDFQPGATIHHYNGIVCFAPRYQGSNFNEIVLYNPALRQTKRSVFPFCTLHPILVGIGFGHDARADDYKLVRIWEVKGCLKASAFTLRDDSWREIEIDNNYKLCILYPLGGGAYCGGVYYWRNLPKEKDTDTKMILAFDMSEEKFRGIPLPDSFRWVPLNWTKPVVWKDSLVLFNVIKHSPDSFAFEMWVLVGKFGGADGGASWTKHLSVGPLPEILIPLCFRNNDELLMRTIRSEIVSYNLRTKKRRTFRTDDAIPRDSYHLEPYTASLVSIEQGKVTGR